MIVREVVREMFVGSAVRICNEEGETLFEGDNMTIPRHLLGCVVEGISAVASTVEIEV